MIGETLAHYRISGKLGAGGMAEVYRAQDLTLGREVAIKVLLKDVASDPDRERRFEQEARAASALNHPNIVQIYEIGSHESIRYMAMELVEGATLRSLLSDGPLDWERLLPIAEQLTAGLAKAHSAGIVHRDLKPENVMVTPQGFVKILDFGLAKLIEVPGEVNSAIATIEKLGTTPGTILGTVGYMSPEQTKGEPADHRSDQFSLGTILYEMAAGKNPFRRDTGVQTLSAVIEAVPEPLSWHNPSLPGAFCSLVERCLAKDSAGRYGSTDELLDELVHVTEPSATAAVAPAKRKRHTVGRQSTVAELQQGLDSALEEGRGSLLCVVGEGGIGKTTVVETFLGEVSRASRHHQIGRGRCSERLAGTEAYLPFLEALESLLREDQGSPARLMKQMAPSWYFQLRPASSDVGTPARASSAERMKRELSSFLEELSRWEPVVLFLEDLHWADVSTVDLLAHLADRFDRMRMLILATYRPEELRLAKHPFLQVRSDLQARGTCREIALPFLSQQDVEHYMSLEFPEHRFPAELPAVIHAKTEGSPLFVVDLLRYLRDKDVIANQDGVWCLAQSVPEIERELPQSVRGMIERKIDRLSDSDRRLMMAASVQGYEFHAVVLAEVLQQDPIDVEDRLEELERLHSLIEIVGEEEFPDKIFTVRYRFVHVLYQNVLHGSLSPTRRVSWSRAVAETLIRYFGEQSTSVASELAVLFESAREPAKAAEHYAMAARNALKVFAFREAIALVHRGLALLESLPDDEARARLELTLQMVQSPALVTTKGYAAPESGEALSRARELCRRLDDAPQLFPILHSLYRFNMVRTDLSVMGELGDELLRIAEEKNDAALLVPAHRAVGSTCFVLGDFSAAATHWEAGAELYDAALHEHFVSVYGQDEGFVCVWSFHWAQWYLGYPERASRGYDDVRSIVRGKPHPYIQAFSLAVALWFQHTRQDSRSLLTAAEALQELAQEHGFSHWIPFAKLFKGWALPDMGQQEKGIPLLREGIDGWQATGANYGRHFQLGLLAEACWRADRIEEGLEATSDALAALEDTGRFWEAEIHRVRGELFRAKREPVEAEASFHRALEIARQQGTKWLELRAATSSSRLRHEQGKDDEARQLLGDVYGWFTEGFDTPDLVDAKALLDEIA